MEDTDKLREFLEVGSDVAGKTAAAAVGILVAAGSDPATGALTGAAAAPLLTRTFQHTCLSLYDSATGRREKIRGGAAAAYALVGIHERLKAGELIRTDGFFDEGIGNRSKAKEILEGVILKSRNEHEEKKTRFYANIFVNAAFDGRMGPGDLNYALSLSQRLTYRQFCLLRLFAQRGNTVLSHQDWTTPSDDILGAARLSLLSETYDLYRTELVVCRRDDAKDFTALLSSREIRPAWMELPLMGQQLHFLLHLEDVEESDLEDLISLLRPLGQKMAEQ